MLAFAWASHPDELRADMQQTYGLDVDAMGLGGTRTTQQVVRAASLCAQLPDDSRTVRAVEPAATWGVTEHILRLVDYKLSLLLWSMTGCNGEAPEPLAAPGDAEAAERRAAEIAGEMAAVAAAIPGIAEPIE